jgi:hypothetical protein
VSSNFSYYSDQIYGIPSVKQNDNIDDVIMEEEKEYSLNEPNEMRNLHLTEESSRSVSSKSLDQVFSNEFENNTLNIEKINIIQNDKTELPKPV